MGCWDFLSVDQPDIADPNSFFDVPITISLTAEPDSGRGYFGILLPSGWTAKDSIAYSGIHNGTFVYSSATSDSMANFHSTPPGYYWWMCEGDSVDSLLEGTISLTPRIYTDNQSGTFFIEYMISDRLLPPSPDGYFSISSGKFPVSINAPMTATVTNTNDSGPGSLRQALSDISSSGEITFNLLSPDTIQLDSQLVIDRNVTIIGPVSGDLSIFGTDSTRVIWINENLKKVEISNLEISHGNDGFGGGIYCVGSNLILNDVSINHNSAIEEGGGILWAAEICGG